MAPGGLRDGALQDRVAGVTLPPKRMRDTGEGAISQGPMVPVLETNDVGQARRAVDLLDAAGIPALSTGTIPGLLVGPIPDGSTIVVVPLSLLSAARETLETAGWPAATARRDDVHTVPSSLIPTASGHGAAISQPPTPMAADAGPMPAAPARPAVVLEDDGPLEAPPFETPNAQTRFTVALSACAFGALLQANFLTHGGFERIRALALSWDGVRFDGNVVVAGFLHGSTIHFLGNLAFGLLLGTVLLGTHGLGATAAVWLAASTLGIAAEAYLSPGAVVLGASAGIYGLVGLWLNGEWRRAGQAVLPRRTRLRALGVILLLAPGALTPVTSSGGRVAVLAHLVGFLVGLFGGVIFPRWLAAEDRIGGESRGRWALGASAALTAAGVFGAFLAVR